MENFHSAEFATLEFLVSVSAGTVSVQQEPQALQAPQAQKNGSPQPVTTGTTRFHLFFLLQKTLNLLQRCGGIDILQQIVGLFLVNDLLGVVP